MTEFLLKIFLKDCSDTKDPRVHSSIGKFAGTVGIICNFLLFIFKAAIGYMTASVSITADAFNNLSDASSSAITLLGFRLAQRPADKEHPYGHARYEYISGLAISVLILFVGIELIKQSINKISDPGEL
ncbi:MAG: cation diffusion facilitator family transporter, partial [Ruminococcaceae bacterium]|nr:cation diffusion facilitator family transporter [Oscillospiraceae bacterium]